MIDLEQKIDYLKHYDKEEISIMEVCGSHTGAIAKLGIQGMLSSKIHLVSGPGCPVCVTISSYVDKLIELAQKENCCIVTFGDLLRVPGSKKSLSMAKGEGARVEMVYSPLDILKLAANEKDTQFIFAAVGFETTTPVYALLLEELIGEDIQNVRLLTALKTMPPVIDQLCQKGASIQGFLAPGHVCVVTGSDSFRELSKRYQIPFGVSGFEGEEILTALYGIVKARGRAEVMNFYPSVVTKNGNEKAKQMVDTYFEAGDAAWRGMGNIAGSGLYLRKEYERFDAGSRGLVEDIKINQACCCDKVLIGTMQPEECPLFGKVCTPLTPQGACMVSTEGSCAAHFAN